MNNTIGKHPTNCAGEWRVGDTILQINGNQCRMGTITEVKKNKIRTTIQNEVFLDIFEYQETCWDNFSEMERALGWV